MRAIPHYNTLYGLKKSGNAFLQERPRHRIQNKGFRIVNGVDAKMSPIQALSESAPSNQFLQAWHD